MKIKDKYWIAVLALAAAACVTMPEICFLSRVLGFFCVSVPMLLLALLLPGAFGGGDIKLMASAGAFLGCKLIVVSAVLAVCSGGLWGVFLILGRKTDRKKPIPFGPFLCIGMAASFLYGEQLADWFIRC